MNKLLITFFIAFLTISVANEQSTFEKDICEEKYDKCLMKCGDEPDSKCEDKCEIIYDDCYEEKMKNSN